MAEPELVRANGHHADGKVRFVRLTPGDDALSRAATQWCTTGRLSHGFEQVLLIVANRGEHEDKVWLFDSGCLEGLIGGLSTGHFWIAVVAHAYACLDAHGLQPPLISNSQETA